MRLHESGTRWITFKLDRIKHTDGSPLYITFRSIEVLNGELHTNEELIKRLFALVIEGNTFK